MNELMVQNDFVPEAIDIVGSLTNVTGEYYCSVNADDPVKKAELFNAMNNPDERLADHINEVIKVKDVYCEAVELVNEQTGLSNVNPRIVLIDEKGKSYQCVSFGVFNALKKIMSPAFFGAPTWENPIPIKVKQITRGQRSMLTLEISTK